jgi:hypothetical protein
VSIRNDYKQVGVRILPKIEYAERTIASNRAERVRIVGESDVVNLIVVGDDLLLWR